ncbi:unnamed protein product [Gongylonema pulchrum]|uniref:Uncharacterized protein n=1 Tax=Gongylonema pulchrum TaxID=637853 RepID=A0A183DX67_9BILA|nr:unnamed protein product [Gongylonema pulchrum]
MSKVSGGISNVADETGEQCVASFVQGREREGAQMLAGKICGQNREWNGHPSQELKAGTRGSISDSVSKGLSKDISGQALRQLILRSATLSGSSVENYEVADEQQQIEEILIGLCKTFGKHIAHLRLHLSKRLRLFM